MKIPKLLQDYLSELKQKVKKPVVVFVDGSDPRIISAANWLESNLVCKCILITKEFIANQNSELINNFINKFVYLRKSKNMTHNQAASLLKEPRYFGAMLLIFGKGNAIISGANMSTKEALLPFLQLFRKKDKFVSSVFLMTKNNKSFLLSDCAVNFITSAKVLANISENIYWFHKQLFMNQPRIALLSFSTNNSGVGSNVKLIQEAHHLLIDEKGFKNDNFYGEIQLDAAVDNSVAKRKNIQNTNVAGNANCFVFPSLNAANIGYKIMSYFGNYQAVGPILTNVDYCCSDLSRGCSNNEVILTAILLCKQYISKNG